MELKNSLVGAVVGAVIGIGLLIAAYFLFGIEHTGFAIVTAILVGLGVRWKVATKGHVSYVRGALTAVLAIASFVGGKFLVAEIASLQATKSMAQFHKAEAPPLTADANDTDTSSGDAAEEVETFLPDQSGPSIGGALRTRRPNQSYPIIDVICLSVAALIAYELGRGSGMAHAVPVTEAEQPPA